MRRTALAAAAAATVAFVSAVPAEAQNYKSSVGIYGGAVWYSDLTGGSSELDGLGDFPTDLDLPTRGIVGAQLERYFGNSRRFGLRLNGAYSESPLRRGSFTNLAGVGFPDLDLGPMNVWFGDLDLMFRFLPRRADRNFVPFASLGAGVVHYNLGGTQGTIQQVADAVFRGDYQTRFALVPSLGTDIIPSAGLAGLPLMFRLEVADHIAFDSPIRRWCRDFNQAIPACVDPEPNGFDEYDSVHNVRGTVGVHYMFERIERPQPVAVAPPPPPPAPAPPPPAEEAIRVCVVDPAHTGGLRMMDALYMPTQGDTLVVENGQRIPLRNAVPRVTVAGDTDWFVAGRPLTLRAANETWEFVRFGGSRVIQANELAYLGTANGLPVYAARRDITPILESQPNGVLTSRLQTSADIRKAFNEVDILYVPADVSGCVFVPLQRVEEVRKIRG